MFANLTGWHMIAILAIVLLIFGAPKLPALARSMGQSMRIFKSEVHEMKKENADETPIDEVALPVASPPSTIVNGAKQETKL